MCSSATTGSDLGLTDKNHDCACVGHGQDPVAAPLRENAIHEDYLVEGLTCSHCVASVAEEVSAIDGVEDVSVELNVGGASRVVVVSSEPVSTDAIRAAVTEAGYSLVSQAGH